MATSQLLERFRGSIADARRRLRDDPEGNFPNEERNLRTILLNLPIVLQTTEDAETREAINATLTQVEDCLTSVAERCGTQGGTVNGVRLLTERTGGRPRFVISRDVLVSMLDLGFTVTAIGQLCNVSRRTVSRMMSAHDLSVRRTYSIITNDDLDNRVREATQFNPNGIGYRACRTTLETQGVRVPYERVRLSMHRVNSTAVVHRWGQVVPRLAYFVESPNAVWHMDGYHKLNRKYKFVIHGCIDGYSRFITFLKVSDNNSSATVCKYFQDAAQVHGLPSRVRMDKGVENIDTANFMVAQRGPGRGSFIAGRSVHNQGIERL